MDRVVDKIIMLFVFSSKKKTKCYFFMCYDLSASTMNLDKIEGTLILWG